MILTAQDVILQRPPLRLLLRLFLLSILTMILLQNSTKMCQHCSILHLKLFERTVNYDAMLLVGAVSVSPLTSNMKETTCKMQELCKRAPCHVAHWQIPQGKIRRTTNAGKMARQQLSKSGSTSAQVEKPTLRTSNTTIQSLKGKEPAGVAGKVAIDSSTHWSPRLRLLTFLHRVHPGAT